MPKIFSYANIKPSIFPFLPFFHLFSQIFKNMLYKSLNQNAKYIIYNDGKIWSLSRRKFLAPQIRSGYQFVRINTIAYDVHRLVAEHFITSAGDTSKLVLDHIDGNKHNNQIDNLRWVTRSRNAHNSKLSKANTSGCKGVTKYCAKFWQYRICVDNHIHRAGGFKTLQEARDARIALATKLLGGFLSRISSNSISSSQ